MQDAGLGLALPISALQCQQHDSECIFVTLEVYFTTFFSEIFCFTDYFLGQGRTDRRAHTWNIDRQIFLGKYYF